MLNEGGGSPFTEAGPDFDDFHVIEDHVNSHEETSKEFRALQQEKGQPCAVNKEFAKNLNLSKRLRTRRFEVRKPVTSQQTKKSVGTRIKVAEDHKPKPYTPQDKEEMQKCLSGLLEFGELMKLDNFKGRKPKYVREKMSKLAKDTKLAEVDDKQAVWEKKEAQYKLQISSLQEEVANLKKLGTEKIKQNHSLDDNWEKRLSKIVKTVVQEKKKKVFKLVEKEFTDIGNETFEEVKLFLMG
ncbi:hypothetical protein P8452_05443 [Trifolium repens]|nr:hypothetical protein P8452_05443 [Trifolium repens]